MNYSHYIRLNENFEVIKAFSSAFESPEEGDILFAETDERHFNLDLIDKQTGCYKYTWENGGLVEIPQDVLQSNIDYIKRKFIAKKEANKAFGASLMHELQWLNSCKIRDGQLTLQEAVLMGDQLWDIGDWLQKGEPEIALNIINTFQPTVLVTQELKDYFIQKIEEYLK